MNPLLDAAKAFLSASKVPDGMDAAIWERRYNAARAELQRQIARAEHASSTPLERQRRLFAPDNEARVAP